jgi:hypothetical protein
LEGWAQDELRSVNGQIEYLLRLAVQKRKGTDAAKDNREKLKIPGRESKS